MSQVRVRFAPSPTGSFHIGSARTALFNWLYAQHTGGKFILRIEDTDKERNTPEALQHLIDGMKWLGLLWDEGPEVGGDFGSYFQSERKDVYQVYLKKLRDTDRAYDKDGAVFFRLEGDRYQAYDNFKKCEVEKVKAEPQVINDLVRGKVERAEEQDFVIFRKNGEPVFHFVNVVDDICMQISHVIRGEDHLSNTSKHCELFKAFGHTPPEFAHIPLILKSHGSGKMSKRDEGALIDEYQSRNFLPAAVRNYLCLLGWSPKDDREVLPIEEIIQLFSLEGINKNNARFDEKKMSFINSEHLRHLPIDEFINLAKPILTAAKLIDENIDTDYLNSVLKICQEKVRSIDDLPSFCNYFFNEDFDFNEKAKNKILKKGEPKSRLTELLNAIEKLEKFDQVSLEELVQVLAGKFDVNTGAYIHTGRLAVSGTNAGPSFYGMLEVLGKEKTVNRINRLLEII